MNKYISLIVALFIGLSFFIASVFIVNFIKFAFVPKAESSQLERIESNTKEIQKNLTPYEYKDQLKKVQLVRNFLNTTKNEQSTIYFNKPLSINGLLSQGYLYIKASINGNKIQKNGDIYVKLSGFIEGSYYELGGHLIEERSLETPIATTSTELLYDLSDVKYKKDYRDSGIEVISANWLSLLNKGSGNKVIGFTSTTKVGEIIELSFYYKCVDGTNCSIY